MEHLVPRMLGKFDIKPAIITYPNYDGSKREGEVEAQRFTDKAALAWTRIAAET
jgi:hypothetical protein